MSSVPIAGIDMFMMREIVFHLREDNELAETCVCTVHLLQQSVDLVHKEMVVIFNEIKYWRELSEASHFKRVYTKLLKQGPLHFLITARNLFENEKTFEIEDAMIDLRLSILRDTFNRLAALVGSLHGCGANIRHILDGSTKYSSLGASDEGRIFDITAEDSFSVPRVISEECFNTLRLSRQRIAHTLRRLAEVFSTSADRPFAASRAATSPSAEDETPSMIESLGEVARGSTSFPSTEEVRELYKHAARAVAEAETEWPATIVANFIRRPTHFQRNWVQYLGLGLLLAYGLGSGVRQWRNGNLQKFVDTAALVIESNFTEHILDPLGKLAHELFDTLRNRDEIVTVEDLNSSRATLQRMLQDYSARVKGVPGGPVGGDDNNSYERTMDYLMKTYETEMSNPLKGLVFGSIMTAMPIQMQKLKMHTEAAILTMDRVIKSNELTMAMTAAIPGLAITGGLLYGIYRVLWGQHRADSGRLKASQFQLRMNLCEVERVLAAIELEEEKIRPPSPVGDDTYPCHASGAAIIDSVVRDGPTEAAAASAHARRLSRRGQFLFEVNRFYDRLVPMFTLPRHWLLTWMPPFWQQHSLWQAYSGSTAPRLSSSASHHFPVVRTLELEFGAQSGRAFHSSGIGASVESEFDGIKKDILDILNPDFHARHKLGVIGRMKTSYACLARWG